MAQVLNMLKLAKPLWPLLLCDFIQGLEICALRFNPSVQGVCARTSSSGIARRMPSWQPLAPASLQKGMIFWHWWVRGFDMYNGYRSRCYEGMYIGVYMHMFVRITVYIEGSAWQYHALQAFCVGNSLLQPLRAC